MTPLVTVIVPCYNQSQFLPEAIKCLVNQTCSNWECIIINDGSTDDTHQVAQELCLQDKRIKYHHKKNGGLSSARNAGIDKATGGYIQFLDADDLIAPDKIEQQMRRLSTGVADSVAAGAWGRFYDTPDDAKFIPDSLWTDLTPVEWLVTAWCEGYMMASHAWLTPRSVIEKAGAWDETPCPNDDGEFFTRVLLNSSHVLFCREAKAYYRSGIPGSWCQITSPSRLASVYRSLELCANHLIEKENSPRTRHACATLFQHFIYNIYPNAPELVREAEAQVRFYGGSTLKPGGGHIFKILAQIVGWKLARRTGRFLRPVRIS